MASNSLPIRPNDAYLDAEWLAGYLTLLKLNRPLEALQHFRNVLAAANSLGWQTKAAFWLGLAYRELGLQDKFSTCLRTASEATTMFYGQLSQIVLKRAMGMGPLRIYQRQDFLVTTNQDTSRALSLFLPLDITNSHYPSKNNQKATNTSQIYHENTDTRKALLKSLYLLPPYFRVRLYKRWFREFQLPSSLGYPRIQEVVPVDFIPELFSLFSANSLQAAFLKTLAHAIILCESEFNPVALSRAGAYGMMQLMPKTALEAQKSLQQRNFIAADDKANLRDAFDNLILGTAHLEQLIELYGYNIILIAAAYNAGNHRVESWIKTYGDPRKGSISLLEWIECIPFRETRFYVKAVWEAFIVYSSLLGTESLQDLLWPLF